MPNRGRSYSRRIPQVPGRQALAGWSDWRASDKPTSRFSMYWLRGWTRRAAPNFRAALSAANQRKPGRITSGRYTIDAKAEGPASQEMMRGPMLQALLEDRFKLRVRREMREIQVYELTVASGGAKLRPYREGSCPPLDSFDPETGKASGQPFINMCGWLRPGRNGGTDVNGTTMANLCRLLSGLADRDVIDKTGIAGMFDIHFDTYELVPPAGDITAAGNAAAPPGPPSDADREERFAQFRNTLPKLGLKLAPAKGQAAFLVIDHVERPSGD